IGAGAASQRESTNSSDGNSGTRRIGECTNRPGECGARIGEVLWRTAAQVWHGAGEPGAGRGIECGVARGPGAAVGRSRIAERAHRWLPKPTPRRIRVLSRHSWACYVTDGNAKRRSAWPVQY